MYAAIGLSLLTGLVVYSLREKDDWERFARTHDCQVVEKEPGRFLPAVGKDALSVYTPGRTAYRCNDGVKYWR